MASVVKQIKRKTAIKKVKAFTLFESVVAITVITVLIGIGTQVYANITGSEKPLAYYEAKEEIDQLRNNLKETKAFFNQTFNYESYEITQQVEFYKGNKKLYKISYSIQIGGKEYWKEQHLMVNEENDL